MTRGWFTSVTCAISITPFVPTSASTAPPLGSNSVHATHAPRASRAGRLGWRQERRAQVPPAAGLFHRDTCGGLIELGVATVHVQHRGDVARRRQQPRRTNRDAP